MSISKQASVHAPGAGSCNSQAKVAAWLQSSDDMDKCSNGEIITEIITDAPQVSLSSISFS